MHYYYLIYPLIGIFTGLMAGLLGLGGGIIMVPVLSMIFPLVGFAPALSMHVALGTSMATAMVTMGASLVAHIRRGNTTVILQLGPRLWPGVIIGAISGVLLAAVLNAKSLALIFATVILLLALRVILLPKQTNPLATFSHEHLPRRAILSIISLGIGALSSLMGVSGGLFFVPTLQHFKVPLLQSLVLSVACGLPLAIVGTLSYIVAGHHQLSHIAWTSGFVYWPAFAGIAITSMIFAPLGVKLANHLPTQVIRWLFVGLLLIISGKMIFTTFH